MEEEMKYLFIIIIIVNKEVEFLSDKLNFYDYQYHKILNFSNFILDFNFIVSFKKNIKKNYQFIYEKHQ